MSNNGALPSGWTETELGVILPLQYGKALREDDRDTAGPFAVYGSSGPVGKHSTALTKGASIIVGRKGNVGATYFSPYPCWPIDTVYFVEATPSTNLRFFSHLLIWLRLVRLDRSTAVPGLSRDDYSPLRVPIPPATEQARIVEAIESLLTKLDAAVAALERVRANLKRYRASLLKAAVEGRLVPTEAKLARREGLDFEPASVLVERILGERHRRWEESELARMKAAGKPPRDDCWKSKYKEPVAPDKNALPLFPDGWCWATVDQVISEPLSNGRSVPTDPGGFPVLRLTALKGNVIDLSERKGGAWTVEAANPFLVAKGDFLVARGNGSIRLVGWGGLVDCEPDPVAFPDTLIRVRLAKGSVLPNCSRMFGTHAGYEIKLSTRRRQPQVYIKSIRPTFHAASCPCRQCRNNNEFSRSLRE